MTQNYYQILGVPRDASPEDITKAFRKLARQYHPDLNQGKESEVMLQLNEAHQVLSKPESRQRYDLELSKPPQRETSTRPHNSPDFGREAWNWFFGGGQGTRSNTEPSSDDIYLPENDWGLLAALVQAYASNKDGKWEVRKSTSDKRDWMSQIVWQVVRDKDNVIILRCLKDWRYKDNRERPIEVRNTEFAQPPQTVGPDTLFSEYYLYGPGKNLLVGTQYINSGGLETYLKSLKSLAERLGLKQTNREGKYDFPEMPNLNLYGRYQALNTKIKDRNPVDPTDREWVIPVPLSNFMDRLREANDLVIQSEGNRTNREGKFTSPSETRG